MKLFRNLSAHRASVFLPLLLVFAGRIQPGTAQWANPAPQQQAPPPQGGYQQGQNPWPQPSPPQQQPGPGAVGNPYDGYYVPTNPQGGGGNYGQGPQGAMNPSAGLGQSTVDDTQPECTTQARISGGMKAQWDDAPFMASLREITRDQYANFGLGHFCGGSIMSPYFILTAGSCLLNRRPQDVGVVVGTLNRRKDTAQSTQLLFVEKLITHPLFSLESSDQDIGLIFLKQAVLSQPHAKSIPLTYQDPHTGTDCTLFGWGQVSRNQNFLQTCLQMAKVQVQDLEQCRSYFQKRNIRIPQMSFCAGSFGGGSDACLGDGGGPVVCNGELYGIINNRIGCGEANVGKVYTNVYSFRNWISHTIQSLQQEYKQSYPFDAFDQRADGETTPNATDSANKNGKRILVGIVAAAGLTLLFA